MKTGNYIAEAIKKLVKNVKYFGNKRYCPVCNRSSRKFGTSGVIPREDAECIHCGALERHRLVWLYINSKTNLFNGASKKMLHVAPEAVFEKIFKKRIGENYLTADLYNPKAMVKMDISDIHYPDESFDVIYCSHVLEHVPDDRKAMREFRRVLKSDGWAILLVPIRGQNTVEDLSITDPAERTRLFGQDDHVRYYGHDFIIRLREASFSATEVIPSDFLTKDEIVRMGITKEAGEIYFCKK